MGLSSFHSGKQALTFTNTLKVENSSNISSGTKSKKYALYSRDLLDNGLRKRY